MSTNDAPENKRDKALAARRRKILEAAVMCFLENGYHQTGVRDIAARANVSLGNLYNHFPGKHDVLVEIAQLEQAELAPFLKLLAKPGHAPKVFGQFVSRYAKHMAAPENVILAIEITSEAIRKQDIGTLFTENQQVLVTALAALLKRGVENGDFSQQIDTEETARMVLELIEGRAYRVVLGSTSMRKLLPGLQAFLKSALTAPES